MTEEAMKLEAESGNWNKYEYYVLQELTRLAKCHEDTLKKLDKIDIILTTMASDIVTNTTKMKGITVITAIVITAILNAVISTVHYITGGGKG